MRKTTHRTSSLPLMYYFLNLITFRNYFKKKEKAFDNMLKRSLSLAQLTQLSPTKHTPPGEENTI